MTEEEVRVKSLAVESIVDIDFLISQVPNKLNTFLVYPSLQKVLTQKYQVYYREI